MRRSEKELGYCPAFDALIPVEFTTIVQSDSFNTEFPDYWNQSTVYAPHSFIRQFCDDGQPSHAVHQGQDTGFPPFSMHKVSLEMSFFTPVPSFLGTFADVALAWQYTPAIISPVAFSSFLRNLPQALEKSAALPLVLPDALVNSLPTDFEQALFSKFQ